MISSNSVIVKWINYEFTGVITLPTPPLDASDHRVSQQNCETWQV